MDYEGLLIQAYHNAEHYFKEEPCVSYLLENDLRLYNFSQKMN